MVFAAIVFCGNTTIKAADGDLDPTFTAQVDNGAIGVVTVQPDGKILIGGTFSAVAGTTRTNLARLNEDGSLDTSFNANGSINAGGNNVIGAIVVQADGRILVGGFFTASSGQTHIARLNADGSLDTGFIATAGAQVQAIVIQPGGTILVGGAFAMFNGTTRERIAQLNPSGTLTTFSVAFNFPTSSTRIRGIALQPDGKILINGLFDIINNGNRRVHLARLNSDGSLDPSFDIGFISSATTGDDVVVQPDGRVLAIVAHSDTGRFGLARYSATGTLETSFAPVTTPQNSVFGFYLQPDGKIVIVGSFTTVNGTARSRIARLNSNGTLDMTFTTSADNIVSAVTAQTDGKLLIGGSFTSVNGTVRTRIARLLNDPGTITSRTRFDFDGDGRADISVFRPSEGNWYYLNSPNNTATSRQWGLNTDKPAPADYDGDGRTDLAVFRDGIWYVLQSSGNQFQTISFGVAEDLPRPADFDGDGRADIAIFRPSQGIWYHQNSSNNQFSAVQFGQTGDVPMIVDFDGDAKSDVAVFRPSNGTWYWLRSSDSQFQAAPFGSPNDIPLSGDFNGDGRSDLAVYRPADGTWYIARPTGTPAQNFDAVHFGFSTDTPVPADYDGDGKTDIAVYRSGNWFVLNSANNQFAATQFGFSADKPIPAAYLP